MYFIQKRKEKVPRLKHHKKRKKKKKMKQYSVVEYLGCFLDEIMSGESMTKRALTKINRKIKFLYRQNRYLSYHLKWMLCNSLIQPHFDFACCAWYPNLSMSLKIKLQTAENACIRFCLGMERRSHIRVNQFEKINWLPVKKKVDKWIAVTAYNFKNKLSPVYVSYIYIL